jgi:hypothetical protein
MDKVHKPNDIEENISPKHKNISNISFKLFLNVKISRVSRKE